jgi:phage prohead protease, HK97 family
MSKTTTITRQTKAFPFQAKDFDDEKGIVRGYLSTFNNVDEGGDRVLPGAFKRTLQNKYEYKKTNNKRYIMPLLWQHDPNTPIGGYTEAKEDNIGLFVELELDLDVQKGKEAYSALKKGYVFQQSIGYDSLQSENTKVDGQWVRDLIEVRLWEGSIVVFPMNLEAVVTDVKANAVIAETKTITGSTGLPIGPRDEAWDGNKAEKQIFAYATKDDETFDVSKLKQCFMILDGDAQQKGSWSYPFCYVVNDEPRICVGAVIAIAGAIGGARNADAPDGLKGKVEKLYKRINNEYPDDPQLTPSWKDDGKGKQTTMQRKTVLEHYAQEMCEDLLEDWRDIFLCTITKSVLDAFKIGDQPEQDISQALDDWKALVLSKFVAQAIECNLTKYIVDSGYSYTPADYTMQYGSDSKPNYGYMSNDHNPNLKAGRSISTSNQRTIDNHIKSLRDTADEAQKAVKSMQDHVKAVRTAADDFASTMQGAETPYTGDDSGKPDDDQQEGKGRNTIPPLAHSDSKHSLKSTADEDKAIADVIEDLKKVGLSLS